MCARTRVCVSMCVCHGANSSSRPNPGSVLSSYNLQGIHISPCVCPLQPNPLPPLPCSVPQEVDGKDHISRAPLPLSFQLALVIEIAGVKESKVNVVTRFSSFLQGCAFSSCVNHLLQHGCLYTTPSFQV